MLGVYFPLEMAVWFHRQFLKVLPVTFMIQAMRSICTRGWGIKHPVVMLGFASACFWISISLLVAVLAGRRKYM